MTDDFTSHDLILRIHQHTQKHVKLKFTNLKWTGRSSIARNAKFGKDTFQILRGTYLPCETH